MIIHNWPFSNLQRISFNDILCWLNCQLWIWHCEVHQIIIIFYYLMFFAMPNVFFCFQTKSSLPGSEDNFWIRYWCYIPQNGIGQWWTTFVSRLSFYVWPQHTGIAYLLSEAKDSESLSMTINSFPKRLVDLVNLFQLKGLTI